MTYGGSLFLIAVGAILRYAVSTTVSGISLTTAGLILMLIGIVGFVLSLIYMFGFRRPIAGEPVVGGRVVERPVAGERIVERERYCDPSVRSY